MMAVKDFLEKLAAGGALGCTIAHREDIPARPPRWGSFPEGLGADLRGGLESSGIGQLYSHQSEAIARILNDEDVVVVTPTASGKTLCYNIPVLDRAARSSESRALYLFPMKALEQDQLGAFRELSTACGMEARVSAEIYDGDTSSYRRAKIRKDPPQVVITNPDMLHAGILAYHDKWRGFFAGLKYIVLDEVHTYRGVFGSHVANVLRRLLRVAAHYGSEPRIISCSATIANPGALVSRLAGREVRVVDGNGAPEAARHFVFVNPRDLSASTVAARLLRKSVKEGLATIVFTKARRTTELIYTWATEGDARLRRSISAYRAGYLPEERREIEDELFSGRLKGVVSTSALEMGIDIGVLDVCILVGYPGTITRTWQRGGRVGRQERESLIVIVAGEDALDQFFMKHPRVFFDTGFEPAVVDPGNHTILKGHLLCAAAELPLDRDDPWFQGDGVRLAVEELEREGGLLRSVEEGTLLSSRRYPHRDVNLRGIGESYTIFEEEGEKERRTGEEAGGKPGKPRVVGSIDGNRVYSEGHPGAVYLHRARQYMVSDLDLERRNLRARPVRVGYYTQSRREKETSIINVRRSRPVGNFVSRLGDLKVTERVTGYEKKRIASGERLSVHGLDLPPSSFETVGFWVEIEDFIPRVLAGRNLSFMGGIHAVEHAAIALFPLFALCEPDDVGGISIPLHPEIGKGAIFFYDGYPGGVGLCEQCYARIGDLLEKTHSLISGCDCEKGCPSCIYSSKCGSGNVPLDKEAAVAILALLLDLPESREWLASAAGSAEEPVFLESPREEDLPVEEAAEPRVLVLDIETMRGAQEVGGWANVHLMGVAVSVLWDSRTGEYTSYFEEQTVDLIGEMVKADLVVGFNTVHFDYRVLSAYDDGALAKVATFDILRDIHRRMGFRVSLAHLAENTLGAAKSADGLQSLAWVREGRLDLVDKYCRKDVEITKDLFLYGLERGFLRFRDREERLLELKVDWKLEELVEAAKKLVEAAKK
jgi:DEAD/DEAH box helicase domain-containing protein